MATYQKRPDTIDAVTIVNPPQPGNPPFQPPVPAWLTDAIAQGIVTWTYDEASQLTTVTLYWAGGTVPRGSAVTGDSVTRDIATLAISTITAVLLDQYYTRGPAEPPTQATLLPGP